MSFFQYRAALVPTANHITFLVLHERNWLASVLRYLLKAFWLADACVGSWKVFLTSATSNASGVTQQIHNSVRQCMTSPIETKWEALMPAPCGNAPLCCNSYYLKCNKLMKHLTFQENSVINYSPSCRSKPVSFCTLIVVISLLSMEGQRALRFHQKYLNLCSEDERRSYAFGTTWGWVINDRIFIFGWTNPLRHFNSKRSFSIIFKNV